MKNLSSFSGEKTDVLIGFGVVVLAKIPFDYKFEQFLIDFIDIEN